MEDFNSLLDQLDSDKSSERKPKQDALDDAFTSGMQNIDTYMDIVFCVDVTSSMQPTINTIKNFTTSLYDDLIPAMLERDHRKVKLMRVKVVAFRDFYCDGKCSIQESSFYKLPDEGDAFKRFVNSLEAKGGGDNPENSLEALAVSMRTDWTKINDLNTQRSRHVIVLFTDDSAHRLEQSQEGIDEFYPKDMPQNFNELTMMWQGQGACDDTGYSFAMDKRAKRLIVFAPEEAYPWNEIGEEWESTVVLPMEKGGGGIDIARDVIINTIGNTL